MTEETAVKEGMLTGLMVQASAGGLDGKECMCFGIYPVTCWLTAQDVRDFIEAIEQYTQSTVDTGVGLVESRSARVGDIYIDALSDVICIGDRFMLWWIKPPLLSEIKLVFTSWLRSEQDIAYRFENQPTDPDDD